MTIDETDCLIPIVKTDAGSSISTFKTLEKHTHENLLPSVLDTILHCDYFCLSSNRLTAYNVKNIVSITSD